MRFRDHATGEVLANETEAFDIHEEEFSWKTPPAETDTKAIMEYSYNHQDWHSILDEGKTYSYVYYNAPRITNINPSYGPVKSPNNQTIDIKGQNFVCPDNNCNDLTVRFGDPAAAIYVRGEKVADDTIRCVVPKYTKPDVLPVEVTFNG